MQSKKTMRIISLFVILATLFLMADTCFHSQYKKQATIMVFEDADGDGTLDRGEAGIPNTLVLGEFNIHGSIRRTGALTDEQGKATLEVEYTHFFTVIAVPPCGATSTTSTSLDATEEKRLRFGFAPQDEQQALSIIQFHLWEDENQNGVQETGEGLLANFVFSVDPLPESTPYSEIYFGILTMQTDAQGNASLNLGNSCGSLLVPFLDGWKISSIIPEPSSTDGGLWFPYGAGLTEISLGLWAIPTPTPYPTWSPVPPGE